MTLKTRPRFLATLTLGLCLASTLQAQPLAPLGELRNDNMAYMMTRCAALQDAVGTLVSDDLATESDPEMRERYMTILDLAEKNADSMAKTAVVAMTTLERKSEEDAIAQVSSQREAFAEEYLDRLAQQGLRLSEHEQNPLWDRDGLVCSVLASQAEPFRNVLGTYPDQ